MQLNGKAVTKVLPKDGAVSVKIDGESQVMYGRHFDDTNQIVSILNRDAIDSVKEYFKDELTKDDWKLVI